MTSSSSSDLKGLAERLRELLATNAELIVAAVNALLTLLDERDRLRETLTAGMTPEQAIDLMASVVIEHAMEQALEDGLWEAYPEVGEHDWTAIEEAVRRKLPRPAERYLADAIALLESRADPEP